MNDAAIRWILAFDGGCGACAGIADAVAAGCGDRLAVLPLQDERVSRHRMSALAVTSPQVSRAQPSAKEIAVATADANCRVTSNYTEAFKAERSKGELAAIGKDIEGFDAVREQYIEYQSRVDKALQELG